MPDTAAIAGPTLLQLENAVPATPSLASAALIVIDAQEEYRSGALPLAGVESALGRLADLLRAARTAGGPVIHIVHKGESGALFDPARFGAIMPEAAPRGNEPVIEKSLPSAFTGTDLEASLRALGVTRLVLAGFMTHVCISSSARAATELGFAVTVAADATATRALPHPLTGEPVSAAMLHEAALTALSDVFANVVPTAAILATD